MWNRLCRLQSLETSTVRIHLSFAVRLVSSISKNDRNPPRFKRKVTLTRTQDEIFKPIEKVLESMKYNSQSILESSKEWESSEKYNLFKPFNQRKDESVNFGSLTAFNVLDDTQNRRLEDHEHNKKNVTNVKKDKREILTTHLINVVTGLEYYNSQRLLNEIPIEEISNHVKELNSIHIPLNYCDYILRLEQAVLLHYTDNSINKNCNIINFFINCYSQFEYERFSLIQYFKGTNKYFNDILVDKILQFSTKKLIDIDPDIFNEKIGANYSKSKSFLETISSIIKEFSSRYLVHNNNNSVSGHSEVASRLTKSEIYNLNHIPHIVELIHFSNDNKIPIYSSSIKNIIKCFSRSRSLDNNNKFNINAEKLVFPLYMLLKSHAPKSITFNILRSTLVSSIRNITNNNEIKTYLNSLIDDCVKLDTSKLPSSLISFHPKTVLKLKLNLPGKVIIATRSNIYLESLALSKVLEYEKAVEYINNKWDIIDQHMTISGLEKDKDERMECKIKMLVAVFEGFVDGFRLFGNNTSSLLLLRDLCEQFQDEKPYNRQLRLNKDIISKFNLSYFKSCAHEAIFEGLLNFDKKNITLMQKVPKKENIQISPFAIYINHLSESNLSFLIYLLRFFPLDNSEPHLSKPKEFDWVVDLIPKIETGYIKSLFIMRLNVELFTAFNAKSLTDILNCINPKYDDLRVWISNLLCLRIRCGLGESYKVSEIANYLNNLTNLPYYYTETALFTLFENHVKCSITAYNIMEDNEKVLITLKKIIGISYIKGVESHPRFKSNSKYYDIHYFSTDLRIIIDSIDSLYLSNAILEKTIYCLSYDLRRCKDPSNREQVGTYLFSVAERKCNGSVLRNLRTDLSQTIQNLPPISSKEEKDIDSRQLLKLGESMTAMSYTVSNKKDLKNLMKYYIEHYVDGKLYITNKHLKMTMQGLFKAEDIDNSYRNLQAFARLVCETDTNSRKRRSAVVTTVLIEKLIYKVLIEEQSNKSAQSSTALKYLDELLQSELVLNQMNHRPNKQNKIDFDVSSSLQRIAQHRSKLNTVITPSNSNSWSGIQPLISQYILHLS